MGPKRPWTMPDPTPEELQARAAEVRAGWTPEEERRRRLGGTGRVELRAFALDTAYSFSEIQY